MSFMRRFVPAFLILSWVPAAFVSAGAPVDSPPRSGLIRGIVRVADTRRPLPGVAVEVRGLDISGCSGADGAFSVGPVPVGSYALRFSLPDLQPWIRTDVVVKSNGVTFIEVDMPLQAAVHESMTVRPRYFSEPAGGAGPDLAFFNEEIRRAPGAAGDVSRIIYGLPSLAKISDQANVLAVRGGSSFENLFILDNIVIPNINHFPGFGLACGNMGLLYVDFIREVNFRAGGFPASFGLRAASVMEVAYREGRRDGLNCQVALDLGGAGIAAEGPLPGKRGSWLFAARRSYLDLLVKMIGTGSMPRYGDFQGKVLLDLGRRGKLTLLGVAGNDRSGLSRQDTQKSGEAYYGPVTSRESTVGFNWFQIWGRSSYSDTSLSRSATRHGARLNRSTGDDPAFSNRSGEEQWRLRTSIHLAPSADWKLNLGGEILRDIVRLDYWLAPSVAATGESLPEIARRRFEGDWAAGGFLSSHWQATPGLALTLGLRLDRSFRSHHTDLSPRISLSWQMAPHTTLVAAGGIYCQPWPLTLLAMTRDPRQAPPFRALHRVIEVRQLLGDDTRLTLTVYDKSYSRLPLDPAQPALSVLDDIFSPTLSFHDDLVGASRARARGVELTLQKKMRNRLYGMAGLSWSRSRYRGLDGRWRNRITDNRLVLSLEGGYRFDSRWEIGGRWILAGGRPFTPIDVQASRQAGGEVLDMDRANADRLPAYRSLNLRVDRRFNFRASSLTAYLSIWNLANRRNVMNYYWDGIRGEVARQLQWGLLPLVGLQYEF